MFWLDVFSASCTGVPIRAAGVQSLVDFVYPESEDAGYLVGTIYAKAPPDGTTAKSAFGKIEILSPEEQMHAPIFACARDIKAGKDEDAIKKWRTFFLSVTVCLVRVSDLMREVKALLVTKAEGNMDAPGGLLGLPNDQAARDTSN